MPSVRIHLSIYNLSLYIHIYIQDFEQNMKRYNIYIGIQIKAENCMVLLISNNGRSQGVAATGDYRAGGLQCRD